MAETPDELAVRYDGLAARVARRSLHRVPHSSADFDDLFQECRVAILVAAREYDGRIPWPIFVTIAVKRAVGHYVRVQRRRGLTSVGDRGREAGRDFEGPVTVNLDDRAWRVPGKAPGDETTAEDALRRMAALGLADPDLLDAAFLVVAHGMSQAQVAELWGVSRQYVGQILAPLRDYLRGET